MYLELKICSVLCEIGKQIESISGGSAGKKVTISLRRLCSRKKLSGRLGSRSFKAAGMSQITSSH